MAITDLRAESVEGLTTLYWSRPRKNADGSSFRDLAGFLILRSEGDRDTFRRVHFMELRGEDIRDGRVLWADPETEVGKTYTYRVSSKNSLKVFSLPSNKATVTAASPVEAPANIRGEGGDGMAILAWDPVPDAAGYFVYRSLREEGPFDRVTETLHREPRFTDPVPNTGTFYYHVRAVSQAGGLGKASTAVRVRPRRSTPPEPVDGLKASYAGGTVYLSWTAVGDTGSFGAYEVCRFSGGKSRCERTAQPSFADRELPESGELRYEVRVVDNSASPVAGEPSSVTVLIPGR